MVSFPNCKINIGLRIVGRRPDGYHDIETIFYPVNLHDAIEIQESNNSGKEVNWSQSGIPVPGNDDDNLCIRAYRLLKKDYPGLPDVNMHLLKAIPIGAGLGGGSADAAFMLKAITEKFNLPLTKQQLIDYALQLGSDCPFFIVNKPCYATGRGELMEEIKLDLSAYSILLVNPGIHINTGWAFKNIKPAVTENNLKELTGLPLTEWQHHIYNDFEQPVFAAHPEIGDLKRLLTAEGAIYASMSGSGSTVFGIFKHKPGSTLKFPGHYFHKWV